MERTIVRVAALLMLLTLVPATLLHPKAAFSAVLFFCFAAALAPGYNRLCEIRVVRGMKYRREIVAGSLFATYVALVMIGFFTIMPLMITGASEATKSVADFAQQAPMLYQMVSAELTTKLTALGVTPEMTQKVADWAKEHFSVLAMPGTYLASGAAHLILGGTVAILAVLGLPVILLFILLWWPYEEEMAGAVVRSILPEMADEAVLSWWNDFTALSTKLFAAMATSMAIFSVVFVAGFMACNYFGYHFSLPRAVFDGALLGVPGGIPVFGGMMNYFTITLISLMNFGLDWTILGALLLMVVVVHKLEVSIVTPWVVGAHLKFSTVGLALCFFAGFGAWGPSLNGIGMSLFLLPFYRATKMLIDRIRAKRGNQRVDLASLTQAHAA